MLSQTCFLLSYVKYGDKGAVLNCFSRNNGYESFFAPNIYAPRNRQKSYLFPLQEIQITFAAKKRGDSLQNVLKIEKAENTEEVNNVNVNSILFFIADLLNQILKEEQHSEKMYDEIKMFLGELNLKNYDAHIGLIFRILLRQGISPLFADLRYVNPESGNFTDQQSVQLFDEEITGVWKNFITSENIYGIKLPRNLRKKMIQSLMYYYSLHIDGFREPVSLSIIQQIYD